MGKKGDFVPVNGQELCEYAKLRFGWLRIAQNGCGAIALYNAMGLTGRPLAFSDVTDCLDRWYRPRFFGVWPREIGRFFPRFGVACTRADSLEELRDLLAAGGVAVLTKWNAKWPKLHKGAHTVAVCFDGEQNYIVYNRYSNRACEYSCKSLEEIIDKGTFIRGYVLGKCKR